MKIKKNSIISSLACVAALALATVTTHAQNMLLNPGFETDAVLDAAPLAGATDWNTFNGANTVSANGYVTRSGIGSLQLPGNGGFGVPGAYQILPAVPGQLWDLQGYMLTSNALPANTTFGLLKIVWSDGSSDLQPAGATIGNALSGANPGIESTPFLNSSSTPNAWQFTRAQGIAPAGTTEVHLFALMIDQSAGTVFFDDLQATNSSIAPLAASITYPANLADVSTDYTINATASVLPGAVTNVYFYVDNALVGNVDTAPYSFGVIGSSLGAHTLKVVAKADTGSSVTSAVVNITVSTTAAVYVDQSKNWVGYMNVFQTTANGGGYVFGSAWATADLVAVFSGSVLTLSPNTINDPSTDWYVSTGNGSVASRSLEANMYVEPVGSLPGKTVTFSGTCINNTLTTNGNFLGPVNPAGDGWTCVAVIKDLAPDYSSSVIASVPVTNGMPFSVSLATINDPARHVQYGFVTTGPCVWPTDTALPGYGKVQIGTLVTVAPTLNYSQAGNVLTFTWTDAVAHLQSQTNSLSTGLSANWVDYPGGAVSGVTATINPANPTVFYRLKKP